MKKVVAVDVDFTVVDSLSPWMDWFNLLAEERVMNEDRSYNLVPEMKAILARAGLKYIDPLDFWRSQYLYDDLEPLEGSVEALNRIKSHGHDLVFVSSCFPEHEDSKKRFLTKHFEFDAFISTHDKHFVGYDVLIDDKLEHMRLGMLYRPNATHLLFTGLRADGFPEQRSPFIQLNHWDYLTV